MDYIASLFTGLISTLVSYFKKVFDFLTSGSVITYLMTSFVIFSFKMKTIRRIISFSFVLFVVSLLFELVYASYIKPNIKLFVDAVPNNKVFSNGMYLLDQVGLFDAINIMISVILIVSIAKLFLNYVFFSS